MRVPLPGSSFRGASWATAHLLRLELEAAGIQALVLEEHRVHTGVCRSDSIDLRLAQRDMEKAQPILEARKKRKADHRED